MKTMHNRLLRWVLFLAVALAVPVQGFAAVVAGQCMAFGHHEGGMAAAHGAQDSGHEGGHGHQGHGDGHASSSPGHESHEAPQQDDGASADHCAPCVACCAAAAISSPFPPFVPDSVKSPLVEAKGTSYSGTAPESLDRPPLAL
jgi:hypothetical protein